MEDGKNGNGVRKEAINVPLLEEYLSPLQLNHDDNQMQDDLPTRVWVESNKLWYIAGPTIFSSIASLSMIVVTQAFAGHLGNLELAAIGLSFTVVIGFSSGVLLGMSSALETLCGQAYGAKQYHMIGIYMQQSFVVSTLCSILLVPLYIFTTPILKLLGQPDDLTPIIAWVSLGALLFHIFLNWLVMYQLGFGVVGATATSNVSWWIIDLVLFSYIVGGGCPQTWTGFSIEAFSGLWEFFKLSVASGVMLCLENWYYNILVLMAGNLNNATVAVSALTVCMSIYGLESMISLGFYASAGIRVANELGAGNGKAAKFAAQVSAITSLIIGIIFCTLIMIFHDKLAIIFTSTNVVLHAVDNLAILLIFTILLNSIQQVFSAIGLGWQACVAYINLGLPLDGFCILVFKNGIWSGMIVGSAVQTLILIIRCNWDISRMNMLSNSSAPNHESSVAI
ncbi:hypothetical protein MKX03_004993 [Papaver bracteatum]|nr:hypothetical protein MKX03_004993 [Papaver bracteatum]